MASAYDKRYEAKDVLRRFSDVIAKANYPRRSILAWMGHEDGDTTEVDMHYAPPNDEVEAIDRAFA